MKFTLATALALTLGMSVTSQVKAQAANQIFGGYTSITFNSSFVASTRESGIFISDLNGNPLPSAKTPGELVDNLGTVSGVIDLDTGVTNVSFRGGFLINYVGRTAVRVENLVLRAGTEGSAITGDLTENGAFLGREEIFLVNQNPGLVLPLKPVADHRIAVHPGDSGSHREPDRRSQPGAENDGNRTVRKQRRREMSSRTGVSRPLFSAMLRQRSEHST